MKKAKLIAAAVGAVAVIVVMLQNTDAVETKFLFYEVTMPRAVLLTVTLLVGFALGVLVSSRLGKQRRR